MKKHITNPHSWQRLIGIGIAASYFYIFMEWVFFATKPSFLNALGTSARISVLFIAGGLLALLVVVPILIILIICLLCPPGWSKYFLSVASVIPAMVLAALSLQLIDNFTYTVFNFGIVSSRGIVRALYIAGFVLLIVYFSRWVYRSIRTSKKPSAWNRYAQFVPYALLLASAVFVFSQIRSSSSQSLSLRVDGGRRPNIIILGSDGMNATDLSVYGYDRDTTPYLKELADTSLFAENAFPNGGNSAGSITSMLTGKLPTQTRVLYAPNILTGIDSVQHLPGILRKLGYKTVEIGVPNYVDSYNVNMQDGFDVVNQQSADNAPFFRIGRKLGLGDTVYFLSRIYERISERLLHIFFIRTMENTYKLVTGSDEVSDMNDSDRTKQLLALFQNPDQPVFVHVHMMGTHGPKFLPRKRLFSAGEEQDANWKTDFYDDAILDFDHYVKTVFNALDKSGELDNTIVVIYTDHNMKYHTTQRIPLMIRFPNGQYAGRIHNNVQNLDIAPTLLDYLGIPIPEWMGGQSLLKGEPPRDRIIFSAVADSADPKNQKPPFYQIGILGVVICNRWYEYSTSNNVFTTSTVNEHTTPCDAATTIPPNEVREKLLAHLQKMKFDVKTLSEDIYSILPDGGVTRSLASRIVLKELHGSAFAPPPATGIFTDIPASSSDIPWMEEAVREGVMDACSSSPMKFCPDDAVTRADAAKIILLSKYGRDYSPPPATGVFTDVPVSSSLAPWVEQLYTDGITAGCVANPLSYCPDDSIIVRDLALLLRKAFNTP